MASCSTLACRRRNSTIDVYKRQGLLDIGRQYFQRLLLGLDAGLEELADTVLHVHR